MKRQSLMLMSVKEIKRKKVAIDYLTLAFDYIEDNIQLDSNSSYISKPISVSLYILPVLLIKTIYHLLKMRKNNY